MELKSNHSVPVLTDPVPINNSRLGIPSNLLPHLPPAGAFSSGLYLTIPRKKPIPGKVDDVRASGYLDAMKSSSPPRNKLIKDFSNEVASSENDATYNSWLVNYLEIAIYY